MTTDRAWTWPLGLALALAGGLAASLAFAWIAARLPADLLAVDPWAASDAYSAAVRARESARERGWELALRADRSADGVRIELRPSSSSEPLPAQLDVRLRRERAERGDFDAELALEPRGDAWVADVPLPLPGRWLLVAHAGNADAWVERTFAVEVPP
jgi:nitrogen fixation protein FixH